MRILVFPHAMELGGSQLNAIELAAAVRDLGHEVVVVSESGMLADRVAALGLSHVLLAPRVGIRPSWRVVKQLRAIQRAQRFDLVHGYEWPPALEAVLGPGRDGVGVIGTVMSMSVAPFLPASMPLIVGTRNIANDAVRTGFRDVRVMEPPVDIRSNAPGAVEPLPRSSFHACPDSLLLVVVCRLVSELKLEGLLSAAKAVGGLNASGTHTHLLIVGDGEARAKVQQSAEAAGAAAGHPVVHLTGLLQDPRPAYAASDIVLGMGGSALRGMAFAKPLIVQGERGFWEAFTPQSAGQFMEHGWYGLGDPAWGATQGAAHLTARVTDLLDPKMRNELGEWGREVVESNYSLDAAAVSLVDLYQEVAEKGNMISARESRTAAIEAMKHSQFRKLRKAFTSVPSDDFNAVPAAESGAAGGRQDA